MIKVNKKGEISRTLDNRKYIEVFFDPGKKTVKGKLEVVKFVPNHLNNGKKFVLITQKVNVYYGREIDKIEDIPDTRLYTNEELDFHRDYYRGSNSHFTKIYNILEEVPSGEDLHSVRDKLTAYPKASLYSIISNHPILTPGKSDKQALSIKEVMDQILRDHNKDSKTHKRLLLDNLGKPQYRKIFLDLRGREDIDLRSKNQGDFYIPETLKKEFYE